MRRADWEPRSAMRRYSSRFHQEMEGLMCWELDYKLFAEQQKTQKAQHEARIREEQRAEIIKKLLDTADEPSEKTAAPLKEVMPAK